MRKRIVLKNVGVLFIFLFMVFSTVVITGNAAINSMDDIIFTENLLEQYYFEDDDVELLWEVSTGRGFDIGSTLINEDSVPDILAGNYAFDGNDGEIIYDYDSMFVGLGDIDNDGKDEVFTNYEDQGSEILRCIDASDGYIIWEQDLESITFSSISIGDVIGDEYNEVIVGLRNDIVSCLNGFTGNSIWRKQLSDEESTWILDTAISDVNNDGENEVTVTTNENDANVFCLEGDAGNIIWQFESGFNEYPSFRTICIDNLNDDPYQEIVLELTDYTPTNVYYGVFCISGNTGNSLWEWREYPDNIGSFQSILAADIIPDIPGKEIIAGGVGGVYCLYGGDNPSAGGRVIWHAGDYYVNNIVPTIVMSAALGDIDGDGLLDVVCEGGGGIYALNGQYGSLLWKYEDAGSTYQDSIICVDLNNDDIDEVVSLNSYYDEEPLFFVTAFQSNFPTNNQGPNKPILDGPTEGDTGRTYDYSAVCSDPENDNLYYYYDWGDETGDVSKIKESGVSVSASKSWNEAGNYVVKVKAIDEHGEDSEWSDPLSVSMPRNKPYTDRPFLKFLQQYPILYQLLLRFLQL